MTHKETDLMEQLESYLLGKASMIVNAEEFCSCLVSLNILDESDDMQLKPGQDLETGQWTEKAIKAACLKTAIGSLVVAFQRSGNERIIEETYEWLQASQARIKNYPVAVKSLANQPSKEESKVVRCTIFEQTSPSDELSKLATFKGPDSLTKGPFAMEFSKDRMTACYDDCSTTLWNWRDGEEKTTKFGVKVKDITWFQYDEEILVLGTDAATVHLLDTRTLEEKWSVRLGDPVRSLKFVESTLVVLTGSPDAAKTWWIHICRSEMQLLHRRSVFSSGSKGGFCMDPDYTFFFYSNSVLVYSTKTGQPVSCDKNYECWLESPTDIVTLCVVDFISAKRNVVSGCKNGLIVIWKACSVSKHKPTKFFRGHTEAIVSLCPLNGHLLSLDQSGKLLMWSGYDLESWERAPPVARVLAQNFFKVTNLISHERWFASSSYEDGAISVWTLPDLWLRTG